MITWDWIRDEEDCRNYFNFAELHFGPVTPDLTVDDCIKYCWMLGAFVDGDCAGFILYEWNGPSEVTIHVCNFGLDNPVKEWRRVKDAIFEHAQVVNAYIPLNRLALVRLAKSEGFEIEKKDDYYHGKLTKTTEAARTSATSSTSNKGS